MATNTKFLSSKGNYKNLIVYQKAECIYDTTYIFAHKFLDKSDRTIDQMVQAARSGKLIESRKEAFITNGGVREEMTRVRVASRAKIEP